MRFDARLIWPTQALLGEGPMWCAASDALYYVDIKGCAIHRYRPTLHRHDTFAVDAHPSFIVPVQGGGMMIGADDGLFLLDDMSVGQRLATVPMPSHNRTNDGTVDHHGRLWFGTMDDEEQQPTGAVYSFADGRLAYRGCEAVVTNGPAVTPDGAFLYHVDSPRRTILRHQVKEDGTLTDTQSFIRLGEGDGYPDGIVLDEEGCLWVALWDGWGVHRYAPTGELMMRVEVPCGRVTKIAFGGPDLRTAYVTTARIGLSDAQRSEQPLAGSLFAFDAPTRGAILPAARIG